MKKNSKLLGILVVSALTLTGCGGSDNDGGSNLTSITAGVAVDPYIKDAQFEEFDANNALLQTSAASDSNGRFVFTNPLRRGSRIVMKLGRGLHAGTPFRGTLKRKIDIDSGPLVVNPLTTLVADGKTETEVLNLVKAITGDTTITTADLTADPMARLTDGDITAQDKSLLAANMSVNTAMEIIGNASDLTKVQTVAAVVENQLSASVLNDLTAASTAGEIDIAAATGVTVTSYIADTVVVNTDGTTDVQSVADSMTPVYIDQIAALLTTDITKPVVITDPTVDPVQVADMTALANIYYVAGITAYQAGAISGNTADFRTAIEKFNAAAALAASITDQAVKDKVLFFGAFAKVLALADPISDATANGLNNFGDILDAFGLAGAPVASDRSNINTLQIEICTTMGTPPSTWQECRIAPLSSTSPTSGELQGFLYNKVGTGLKDAISLLAQVSDSFNATVNDNGIIVEFDATDAKFITAIANGILAQINFLQGYNVDVDLDNQQTIANSNTSQTPEQFLAAHPNLGKLKDRASIAAVKTYANAAITALEGAIAALQAEADTGDNQANDFIKFDNTNCYWNQLQYVCDPTTYNDPAMISDFSASLTEVKTILNSTGTYDVIDNGPDGTRGTSDDTIAAKIDVSKFFAGVDLRSKIPTSYNKGAYGKSPGMLPDPTFGGVLVQIMGQAPSVLNTDIDGDGSPDIFDLTYIVPSLVTGNSFQAWINDGGYTNQWTFNFGTATAFTGTIATIGGTINISGTYTISRNVLTLNFTEPVGTDQVTRLVATLESGYKESDNGFYFITAIYSNTTLLRTTNVWLQRFF